MSTVMLGPFSPSVYDTRFAEMEADMPVPVNGFILSLAAPQSMRPKSLLHWPTNTPASEPISALRS